MVENVTISKKEYDELRFDSYMLYFREITYKAFRLKGYYGYNKKQKDFLRKEISKVIK